jgi:4-hydroxybutyrate CoA-transferase
MSPATARWRTPVNPVRHAPATHERSAAGAVGLIPTGATIAVEGMSAEPTALTDALARDRGRLESFNVIAGILLAQSPLLQTRGLRLKTWFAPPRSARPGPAVDYMPLSWYQAFQFLRAQPIDAALVMVSPEDDTGHHNLGISVGLTRAMIERARLVVAQVNRSMPRTGGDSLIHKSRLDVIVRSDRRLPAFPTRDAVPAERVIAAHLASLIPDRSFVQIGIGTIPNQVLEALAARGCQDITVVSLLTEGFRALHERAAGGALPKAIVSEVLGSAQLYKWVDANPSVVMVDASRTHDPRRMPRARPFYAINAALEVDLFGQANMDLRDGLQVGGVGGSIDFAIGAAGVRGGFYLGLRSTGANSRSRIVSRLLPGPVSISRTLVTGVATEFGVADLRFLTLRERAQALINIAHPDHRPALRAAWRRIQNRAGR